MTTVLVVGGGANQVPLVKTAQAMGARVVVTDMWSSPPCRAQADAFEQVDTTDHLGTLAVARKYGVTAVVTDQTDAAVPTAAYIADELGLAGVGYEVALRFSNKLVCRTFLRPLVKDLIPDFQFFDDEHSAVEFARAEAAPLVVKPINSQGSKGVARLYPGLESRLISAAFSESRGRGVLLEDCAFGHEYSVESFIVGGQVHNLAVTKKYHYPSNPCIDVRNTYLSDVPLAVEQALYRANARVIAALGLPFGSAHAEFMVEGERVTLMEIACRGGGGGISTVLIPFLTGFSPNEALLSLLLDRPYDIFFEDYRKRFAILKFFEFSPGVVRDVSNLALGTPGLLALDLQITPGQEIREVSSSRDRPGYFIVSGESRLEVIDRERLVQERVHVNYAHTT